MRLTFKELSSYIKYLFIRNLILRGKIKDLGTILILAPHPDDEIIGVGGILAQQIQSGCKVYIVYLTDGEGSGVYPDREMIKRKRIAISEEVCFKLGLTQGEITRLHFPDGGLPHSAQEDFTKAVYKIKGIIELLKPDVVFSTHTLDYWPFDHVACANIAKEAVKLSNHKSQLWYYWVWAWYNMSAWKILKLIFSNHRKIDINPQMAQKKILMDVYLKAVTPNGKPWSGVLPKSLLKAFDFPVEIIERII